MHVNTGTHRLDNITTAPKHTDNSTQMARAAAGARDVADGFNNAIHKVHLCSALVLAVADASELAVVVAVYMTNAAITANTWAISRSSAPK